MKFFPADWQADDGLRQCGLTARGLWIEMIAIMHKSEIYGHLLIAGVNPSVNQIAAAVRADPKIVKAAIDELEGWRVFSRTDDGIIFSRRMVEDAEKQQKDIDNGGKGGNPSLKGRHKPPVNNGDNGGVNPLANPSDNRVDKAHIPEARKEEAEATPLTAAPVVTPPSLWADGLTILRRITSRPEQACRAQIGKWRRILDDDATLFGVIHEAETQGIADPMAWIERAIQHRVGRHPAQIAKQSKLAWMLEAPPQDDPFTIEMARDFH